MRAAILDRGVRGSLFDKLTLKQGPEEVKGASQRIFEETVPGRGNGCRKYRDLGACLAVSL